MSDDRPRWLIGPDGTAHLLRRMPVWDSAESWCGKHMLPRVQTDKKPWQPDCFRCGDAWVEHRRTT